MKHLLFTCSALTIGLMTATGVHAQQHQYHVAKTFHIASTGGWDYLAIGPANKLYVSHGTQVNVLDKRSGDSIGVIPNTTGVHGIAFIPSMNRGYTSNGKLNNVTVFDLKTQAAITQIPTSENPDAIMYEEYSKKIVTCNGRGRNLSVIDPATNKVTMTIDVGGKPETAVSDNAGKVYVNIEDKNEIAVVDIAAGKVLHRWPLSAEGPTGLAMDVAKKRLFAGCEKQLVVLNAENGKEVAKLPIGADCDGVAFDNKTKTIFTANGEGTISVIKEKNADAYNVVQTLNTKKGARTITIDDETSLVYLPVAEFKTGPFEGKRPPMVPGTFQVLVVQ